MTTRSNKILNSIGRVLLFIFSGLILPIVLFLTLAQAPLWAQSNVIFVDADAGGANDGSSWSDAYTSLQDALAYAESNGADEIWVAAGIYYPDEGVDQTDDDQTSAFHLVDGVEIYGGFAATETLRDERNWATNVTVLSGDVDHETNPDITDPNGVITDAMSIMGNNAHTVVVGSGTGSDAVLDGFAITGGGSMDGGTTEPRAAGMANEEGSPTLANLLFSGNLGEVGAMSNITNSNPSLTNVTFKHNFGLVGSMLNMESNPTLTDVTLTRNVGLIGPLLFFGGEATLTNVTVEENQTALQGGGLFNIEGVLTINNSRIISNSVLEDIVLGGGRGILDLQGAPTIRNGRITADDIFNLPGAPTLNNSNVTPNDIVLTGGGGGIFNMGVIIMSGSRVEANVSSGGIFGSSGSSGGGILNLGVMTVTESIISRNQTGDGAQDEFSVTDGGFGGGIFNAGVLTMTESIVSHNQTGDGASSTSSGGNGGSGGGILNIGILTVTESVISHNQTGDGGTGDPIGGGAGSGGGVFNLGGGEILIVNSSIISNSTGTSDPFTSLQAEGGGIANAGSVLRMVNSTVSGNETEGNGGGIFDFPLTSDGLATVHLHNVTLSGNRADADNDGYGNGGGLYSEGAVGLHNSILAGNSDGTELMTHADCSVDTSFGGSLASAFYNLIGDDTGCDGLFADDPGNNIEGNLVGVAPEIAALGEYGGLTPTHALLPASPARDAGDPDGCLDAGGVLLSTDQRGTPRPESTGGRCDIGAVEYTLPLISAAVAPQSVTEDDGVALTLTFTRTHLHAAGELSVSFDAGGTATYNSDYTLPGASGFDGASGSFTFGDGVFTKTLLITPMADHIVEPDETVIITLTAGADYELGAPHTATGTIVDDDAAGVLVEPTTGLVTTEAGGADTFTITLQRQPVETVSVSLSSDDPGEGTVSPATLTFDGGNWNTPQVVIVTGVDDDEDDGDQAYTIVTSVSSEDPDYDGIPVSDVGVTNMDDDAVYVAHLPLILGPPLGLPDLVVDGLSVSDGALSVVIANIGQSAVLEPFWVDVYIDPHTPPTGVNDVWWRVGQQGLVWGITEDALPLGSGETLTLTVGDAYFAAEESEFDGAIPAGTVLYAQVDSAHTASAHGGVLETHEADDGPYNNIMGPLVVPDIIETRPAPGNAARSTGLLPPRPQ